MSSFGLFFLTSSFHNRSRPARTCFWSALWALSSVTGVAAAEPTTPDSPAVPEQVELSYSAAPSCPSKAAFVDEIAARIRRPIEWVEHGGATKIVVTVGETDGHATGVLQVLRSATEPTRREFIASSCSDVSSALALVTALTLDPNARTEALPKASSEPVPMAPTVTPPVSVAPAPAPPVLPAPVRAAEPNVAPPTRYVAWLGPVAGVANGYTPEPLVSFGLSLGARAAVRRGFSPSFQLTPLWGKTGSTGPSAAGGTFALAMARLEACPTQLQIAATLAFEPCVAAEVGRLSARGADSQIAQPVTADRWWFAAGATLSLHFSLGRWFTRFGVQGLFPATRDEFVFRDPDQNVHQAGVIVYGGSLGLGFQFGG